MKYWELVTLETDGMFFFTTDHLQGMRGRVNFRMRKGTYRTDEDPRLKVIERQLEAIWTPCTYRFPQTVVPREGLEDGIIDTIEKFIGVFHKTDLLMMNPDRRYQPKLYQCHNNHTTTDPGLCFCGLFPSQIEEWKDESKTIQGIFK